MNSPNLIPCLALATILPSLAAQQPALEPDFTVPIHTQSADDHGLDSGLWAAGPDYKVSFHNELSFYPVLGEAYSENLPLRWRTSSVTAGGKALTSGTAAEQWTDWRFERRDNSVSEAYDVRRDGVEQTFVLHQAPAFPGDVVVTGTITTQLHADPVESRCAPIVFSDERGTPIIEYGAALAFDANGRQVDVPSSYDGTSIRLSLPASFLANAVFPVTIDPLISSRVMTSSNTSMLSSPDIVRNDERNEILVTYGRAMSGADWDVYARVYRDDHRFINTAFYELSAATSSRYAQAAYVGGSNRWVIAYERVATTSAVVLVYVHASGDTSANSGQVFLAGQPGLGVWERKPSIGGTPGNDTGRHAYVVFRRDRSATQRNTPDSETVGVLIDCTNAQVVNSRIIGGGPGIDTEGASISRMNSGGTNASWLVVWQELQASSWMLFARRIGYDGSATTHLRLASSLSSEHRLRPKIAGAAGRYLVAWVTRQNSGLYTGTYGNRLEVQRLNWPDSAAQGSRGPVKTVLTAPPASLTMGECRPIAFDSNTGSHWGIAWHETGVGVEAARLGYNGEIVERVTLQANTANTVVIEPSATYNDDAYRFHFAYRVHGSPHQVKAVAMSYPSGATARSFGNSCRGSIAGVNSGLRNQPYAGSEFYRIDLRNGFANTPATLFVAGASGRPMTLPMSMGCLFYLDTRVWLTDAITASTNANGNLSIQIAIPEFVRGGNFYWQFVQLSGGRVWSSNALETLVR